MTGGRVKSERTDFGVRNYATRNAGDGSRYVRITNFIMPNKVATVGSEGRVGEGYSIHWHVPVDDENHIRFYFIFNRARPVAREFYAQLGAKSIGNRYRRNKRNRYLQDRELMKTINYSGMGDHSRAQHLRHRNAGPHPRPLARAPRHQRHLHHRGPPSVAGRGGGRSGRA